MQGKTMPEEPKKKRAKANDEKDNEEDDLIHQMPEGIPAAILSKLPIEDAVRTSILSRKWRHLWTHFSGTLNFDGSPTMKNIKSDLKVASGWHLQLAMNIMFDFERRTYISWINELLNSLKSPTMEGFTIWFDVGFDFDVHNWVQFAMQKNVQKLELYFGRSYNYILPLHLFNVNNSLRILRLKHVVVTNDMFETLLSRSAFLETLSLVSSGVPQSVKVVPSWGSSLRLKRLVLVRCREMRSLEILAENLEYFRYVGPCLDARLKSVPRLMAATFGGSYLEFSRDQRLMSQIKVLKLDITQNAHDLFKRLHEDQVPTLENLRYLELIACDDGVTLGVCALLLKASTSLPMLVLKMRSIKPSFRNEQKFWMQHQHRLKEFELIGFSGAESEVEIVMHVLNNASKLKKITIDPSLTSKPKLPPNQTWDVELNRKRAWELREKVPSSVQFVCL